MNLRLGHLATLLGSLILSFAASGCSNKCATTAAIPPGSANAGRASSPSDAPTFNAGAQPTDASRAIAEADIIQLDGDRLYALSKSGSLAIVDVSAPGSLTLLGKRSLSGEPFEMYRIGDALVVMSNGAISADGTEYAPRKEADTTTVAGPSDGALVTVLDVRDATSIPELGRAQVPGQIADSRLVGRVLYLATYENGTCHRCSTKQRTVVTSFDVTLPSGMKQVAQLSFDGDAESQFNAAWGMAWKRSIMVTDKRLYVGGHADFDPYGTAPADGLEGIVDVVDISDPTGKLAIGAHLKIAGPILSRWQLDETGGVLRVISQRGVGRTANGVGSPSVDTFEVQSAGSFVPVGHTDLVLPRQEGLRTVRFDGPRAYAITFNQTDPLFTIDLSNPAAPKQRGELHMPGWMFYLQPHGDRVIGLGLDRTDPEGSLNVSLFDVADLDAPKMLARVPFGAKSVGEDYAIINYELPEDQDRIQKAFRVFDGGLVAVPYTGTRTSTTGNACTTTGGIQLIDWKDDSLKKLNLLSMSGNPRRAFLKDGDVIGVSDSNVSRFPLTVAGTATNPVSPSADVVIGSCVAKTLPNGAGGGWNEGWGGGSRHGSYAQGHADSPGMCGW